MSNSDILLADALRATFAPEIADSPLAVLALQLAQSIDRGERIPECSRELRQCLAELRVSIDASPSSALDELQAKREQRRNA